MLLILISTLHANRLIAWADRKKNKFNSVEPNYNYKYYSSLFLRSSTALSCFVLIFSRSPVLVCKIVYFIYWNFLFFLIFVFLVNLKPVRLFSVLILIIIFYWALRLLSRPCTNTETGIIYVSIMAYILFESLTITSCIYSSYIYFITQWLRGLQSYNDIPIKMSPSRQPIMTAQTSILIRPLY